LKLLAPPERFKEIVPFMPWKCEHCLAKLSIEPGAFDPPPTRGQVVELMKVVVEIKEYQGRLRTSSSYGLVTRAGIPVEIIVNSVGLKLTAMILYLSGCHSMCKRGVEEVVAAVFDALISFWTGVILEEEVSVGLIPVHQQAFEVIKTTLL
jgi:hypothetical protein